VRALLFSVLFASAAPATAGWSAQLYLVPLEARGVDAEVARGLDVELARAIKAHGTMEVIDASETGPQISHLPESQSCHEPECAARLAYALGAQLLVTGVVSKKGDQLLLSCTLFDARAPRVLSRAIAETRPRELAAAAAKVADGLWHRDAPAPESNDPAPARPKSATTKPAGEVVPAEPSSLFPILAAAGIALGIVAVGAGVWLWREGEAAGPAVAGAGALAGAGLSVALILRY
jgi:hypothetical protein